MAERAARGLVRAVGAGFRYGADVALRDLDLEIAAGDRVVLLGPNGGGKSTLVRLLLGLLEPTEGEVRWLRPRAEIALGYVPQFPAFDRGFPIRLEEMVRLGLLRGRRGRTAAGESASRVDEVLAELGLQALRGAYLSELSGGETQRALLARALVARPQLLVLDEPTASLDEASRRALWARLETLPAETAILLVTHDLAPGTFAPTRALFVDREANPFPLAGLGSHPALCGHGHDGAPSR